MEKVTINGKRIMSWKAFHNLFARTFGFPDFYGANMNAWIDCMSDLDYPEHGMSKKISLKKGESLELVITNALELMTKSREIYDALIDCTKSVNQRRLEIGEQELIHITFKE